VNAIPTCIVPFATAKLEGQRRAVKGKEERERERGERERGREEKKYGILGIEYEIKITRVQEK
jgi:hypothetical protein